jgi:hypothetical protein
MNRFRTFGVFIGLVFAASAFATEATPPCLGGGKQLTVMNEKVHTWKTTTVNQFLARARVHGTLSKVYPEKNRHAHFEIEFDGGVSDTLEVVYSLDFGKLPKLAIGMEIEACGDYITSNAATSQYPASPDGAIIHWIHRNPKRKGHESGYLMIDGRAYGK